MKTTIQSKRSFVTCTNAKRACHNDGRVFVECHKLPSGRWCYVFEVTI